MWYELLFRLRWAIRKHNVVLEWVVPVSVQCVWAEYYIIVWGVICQWGSSLKSEHWTPCYIQTLSRYDWKTVESKQKKRKKKKKKKKKKTKKKKKKQTKKQSVQQSDQGVYFYLYTVVIFLRRWDGVVWLAFSAPDFSNNRGNQQVLKHQICFPEDQSPFEKWSTLKGKNLLPKGTNSSLLE